MADDLYDAFGDGDVYFEEEEEGGETVEGEGQNRLFLIIAGGMALMLLCTLGLFAWWLTTGSPAAQQRIADAQIDGTPTEVVDVDPPELMEPTETATPEPTETPTPTPTATPTNTPTPTPVVGEPTTPTPENGVVDPDNDIDPTPERERRTPTPTSTPRYTPTPRPDTDAAAPPTAIPDTGFGNILLVVGGFMALGMALMIRRLRKV